jgi:LysM repeat protein
MSTFRRILLVAAVSVAALAAPSPVAAADGQTYVVRDGDSLYGIATSQGVAIGTLLAANDLTITSVILPGQHLSLPGTTPGTGASTGGAGGGASGGSYTVVAGDSLSGIAARHGVRTAALLQANGLELSSVILPGRVLQLPSGATVPSTAPAATPSTRPSATSNGGGSYTVVAGDSLSAIASRHGVRLSSLLEVNQLELSSVIVPGRVLRLPADASTPAAPTPSTAPGTAGSYTVVAGDSLSRISSRHGITVSALMQVNGLELSSVILPGQSLRLPAGASAPSAKPAATSSSGTSDSSGAPGAAPATSGATYTVVAGDSLSGIASRNRVSLTELLRLNGLRISSLILPGRVLHLPDGATPKPVAPAAAPAAAPSGDERVDTVVRYALAQLGKPYAFFSRGPDLFDCSGLTLAAYAQVGIGLVHYSAAQANQGVAVDLATDSIRAGDLVFQRRRGSDTINHVGIAIDGSRWVQAIGTGEVVRVGSIPAVGDITAVRRYLG